MSMPPTGHSSSIDSASSFSSSKSSLLAPPVDDEVSSQSDVADSVPHSMPRSDTAIYGVAASPTHPTSRGFTASVTTVSATQKFKRAFGKRRRPSQDAGSLLSSGDERYAGLGPLSSSPHHLSPGGPSSSSGRPSAAKLTMHLFGARKHHGSALPDPNQPPPLPPKPPGLRAPAPTRTQISTNNFPNSALLSRSHNSLMVTSPSITAAIEFMREDEERQRIAEQQQRELAADEARRELEENKENWRKSDSTMGSGHTVRPANNATDTGPGAANQRISALLVTPPGGDMDLLEFLAGTADPGGSRPNDSLSGGKQGKRRSRSLNIQVPLTHMTTSSLSAASVPSLTHSPYPTPPATTDLGSMHHTQSSTAVTPNPPEMPVSMRIPASSIITSVTVESPVSKTNIRGRLAAWSSTTAPNHRSPSPLPSSSASTSTPSLTTPSITSLLPPNHRRVVVTSDASNPSSIDMQAIAAVRQLQNRVRSPSASSTSSPTGIRQAATSLTSGAGAMALGLGKRAYEKVGRVWNSSQSGSGSDTPSHRQPSPVNAYATNVPSGSALAHPLYNAVHGPSAFPPHGRRTPGTSGTWSVSSLGGSRSSSEKDRAVSGPELSSLLASSASSGLGRLIRPPRSNTGGIVFGKDIWSCVKDTRAMVAVSPQDPLSGRMIPALVYRCAQHIHKWGLEEEGLFRISGRSSHIARLRNEFDGGADYDITECSPSELDPHAVASVFKAYLRELPEPILTRALGPSFEAAINAENIHAPPSSASGIMSKSIGGPGMPSGPRPMPALRKPPSLSTFTLPTSSSLRAPSSTLIETLSALIARLPRENRDVLLTVIELMNATAARSIETKMPLSNLLLVFCPSLSMLPTLLRVLCDVPSMWEQQPPVVDISRVRSDEPAEDSDDSMSVSDSEDDEVVMVPVSLKGKEKEITGIDTPLTLPRSHSTPEMEEVKAAEQITIPIATSRSPRAVRRVPVPTLYLDANQQLEDSHLYVGRSHTPPLLADPPLQNRPAPSPEIPSRSQPPSPSPMRSQVSLNSMSDKSDVAPSPTRQPPSSSHSSAFVLCPPPNQDKSLPASPRSPALLIIDSGITQEAQTLLDQSRIGRPLEAVVHKSESSDTSQPRSPEDMHPEGSRLPLGEDLHYGSAPQLRAIKDTHPERSLSLPNPLAVASRSAPNVAFPTTAKTAPSTPTSLKKHALTLSFGRGPKVHDETELPSPSKRLARRPSLNMLLNLKRSGSPSPRPRTPTISSPLTSPVSIDRASEISPTKAKTLPPVLTLPIVGSMDVGLGWDDVFGSSEEAAPAPAHQRTATVSQSSAQSSWPQPPPSPSQQPTEHLTSSSGFFNSRGAPVVFPSATAVLEAASSSPIVPSSSTGSTSDVFPADSSSSIDRSIGDSTEPTPVEEPLSPPPHINFQLRGSSLEDEDWASIVLMAAGKPAEPLA